ncbi:unnamed protein product [Cylicocyclus nassatus]|uniref:Uncharacterized protein n=1 Tax=Cylicocyclus nassatus TaxID=53992 RepID=A0AA36H9N1_CYLNA|nr:unnamed protein product [Cylicocyclus nassatus]
MTYSVSLLFLFCYLLNVDTVAQSEYHDMQKRSMLDDDPCLDAHQIENLDSVELLPRYAHLKRPWLRADVTPKIFTSDGLRYQWMWAKSLVVRGLSNDTTVDDILRFLDGQNCSFLAIGDAVWQTVHRIHPVRFEGEISCPMKELYTICLAKYGNTACSLFPLEGPSPYKLEIGDARADRSLDELKAQPLVLYEWGSTLGLPAQRWGYTVTTMAIYDNNAGQVYLIDMTGKGYMDTCGKRISAAVDNSQWKAWADGDISKVYRFYLLRTQGFGVSNHDLQNFINKMIQSESNKKVAQTFYCESILGGIVSWAGDGLTTTCHVMYPDNTDRRRIVSARDLLSSEMGAHWIVNTAPAIDEMEAVYLTERQFVDVRDRLKGRITGDPVFGASDPLRLGIPTVNDIAEVQRRPLLKLETTSDVSSASDEVLDVESSEEAENTSAETTPMSEETTTSEEAHIPKRDTGMIRSVEPQTNSSASTTEPSFILTDDGISSEEFEDDALKADPSSQQSLSLDYLTTSLYMAFVVFVIITDV